MMMRLFCAAVFALSLAATPSRGDNELQFMLDTGGHEAIIQSLAFTPDGKYILSAGDDKVIRIWDWRAGETVRTIRGQSSPGAPGAIYAMALSTDGRWLAVGGFMNPECRGRCGEIRLYDFATGNLLALLEGHSDVVQRLVFSPDSKLLLSAGADFDAIIWNVESRAVLHRLHGHSAVVDSVGFTPDGARAVTGGDDKTLRLWRVSDGSLIKEMTGHERKLFSLDVSSAGSTIASGDHGGEIRLWDGTTGEPRKVLANQGDDVGSVKFSPDGRFLLVTGGRNSNPQRIYDATSGKVVTSYAKHSFTVLPGIFSPDGRLVATAGGTNNEIHVWDPRTGETKAILKGFGQPVWSVAFSADGRSIAWGSTESYLDHNNRGPLEMTLRLPDANTQLGQPAPIGAQGAWVRAAASFNDLSLMHRRGPSCAGGDTYLDLLKHGIPTEVTIERHSTDGCEHRSYSFTPDGLSIISGASTGNLTTYSLDGQKIRDFTGHDGDVYAVAPSPDGTYLVSGALDQTVRLWNLKTGELLVTLFRAADGEWVMWTPQGYYTGSPGADRIVGWQINKGDAAAADYVTAEQLRKHLNRPDIVEKAIRLASAAEAVRTSYGTEFKLSDLLAQPAPHLRILSPVSGSILKTPSTVTVRIAIDDVPDPVTRIRIQINGRQLDDFLPEKGPSFAPGEHAFDVPLARGKNTIVVTAFNKIGWSRVQDGTLVLENESVGLLDKRGTLYIMAVGVTKYPGIPELCRPKPTCDLNFTGNDAIAFADTIEKTLGALHEHVVRRVLVNEGRSDGAPTAANIINALGILSRAKPNDTVAVFLAGHGMNDGPNYRFVSTDASLSDGMILPASMVPWYAIEEAIDSAKGRRLLFIDTCHAAGAYNERLGNTSYHANILAYSSARWDQVAWESPKLGHGFFTEAIVEGLTGKADASGSGRVDTAQLNAYLQARVRGLAKSIGKEQDPQFFKGRDAEVYLLAQ